MQELISIEDESKIIFKGANKVVSSIPSQCVVDGEKSTVIFSGSSIEVTKLDIENKEVVISGSFTNIKFTQKGNKQPLLKRIFK